MFRSLLIDQNGRTTSHEFLASADANTCLTWIDLTKQDESSLQMLDAAFGFHPLTLEDCLHFDQRPKLERYEGYLFLVLHCYQVDWESLADAKPLELHLFIGRSFVVSVHEEVINPLELVWTRVQQDGRLAASKPGQLTYLIADAMTDSFFPVIDETLVRIDQLEDSVLDAAKSVCLGEILDFKSFLVQLRKVLSPQRDVLALLAKHGQDELICHEVSLYFRDVYDHALRISESVEAARELVSNVRDAYLWNASQRTNEIMKRLTILSAIFLPLTFITGFFGQNFESLPFGSSALMYVMLACCLLIPVVMLAYFSRSKWFDNVAK